MMIDLNTTKQYLRVEHSEDDQLIEMMMTAARAFVESYLNQRFIEMDTVPNELIIPQLALIATWYAKREITTDRAAKEVLYNFRGILDMHKRFVGGELI